MSTAHLEMATQLSTDALVELYSLDTTALVTTAGVAGQGQVFNWTPGTLPQRIGGTITAASGTSVTLDQLVHPSVSGGYSVTLFPAGAASQQIMVNGFAAADGLTTLTLQTAPLVEPSVGTEYILSGPGYVSFNGTVYTPFPITVTGFEWSGQGTMPRPKMRIDNTVKAAGSTVPLAASLVITFADMLGAQVTRLRTFASMLDGQPNADPSAVFEPDIFRIDRKSLHDKTVIEFELAATFDQEGLQLPARQVLRDVCNFRYRQYNSVTAEFDYGTCPYTGSNYFTYAGTATTDPSQDVCRKILTACLLRFGQTTPLPIAGFPGVGLTSV
jgi:lambda family phage minor tail protein L